MLKVIGVGVEKIMLTGAYLKDVLEWIQIHFAAL